MTTALVAVAVGCVALLIFGVLASLKRSAGAGAALTLYLFLALVATWATRFLFQVGQAHHWRGDPGIFGLMIGFAAAVLFAFVFWGTFLGVLLGPADSAPRPLPRVCLAQFGFADPYGLVFGSDGLRRLDFGSGRVTRYAVGAREMRVDEIAGAPAHRRIFYSHGANLYLVRLTTVEQAEEPVRLHRWRLW